MLVDFLHVRNVDYRYWAEKMRMVGRHQTLTRESADICNEWIDERIAEIEADAPLSMFDRERIREEYESCMDDYDILRPSKLQDLPDYLTCEGDEISLAIDDAWELDFSEYRYGFLVACEGLRYAAEKWAEHTTAVEAE